MSNIIYIKFQNCCFFSLRCILKEVLQKCTQTIINQWSSFFGQLCRLRVCNFTKYMLLYKYFPTFLHRFVKSLHRVSRNFTNLCFPKNLLVAAASRCKVLKIFISMKVTVYMQGRRLRPKKI